MPTPKTKVLIFLSQCWYSNHRATIKERTIEKVLVSNRFRTPPRAIRRLMRYFEDLKFVTRVKDGYVTESFVAGRNEQGFAILDYRRVYHREWSININFRAPGTSKFWD